MRADAMFHRALVRACHNETIQAAMRGLGRQIAPIRDAYSGGLETDRQTLDVHRRQLEAMRRRDDAALAAVLDEHFRMLEAPFARAIGRRWSDLFGARAQTAPHRAHHRRLRRRHEDGDPPSRSASNVASRRHRGPRRRPGAASVITADYDPVHVMENDESRRGPFAPRPASSKQPHGMSRARKETGATRSIPWSNDAPRRAIAYQQLGPHTCTGCSSRRGRKPHGPRLRSRAKTGSDPAAKATRPSARSPTPGHRAAGRRRAAPAGRSAGRARRRARCLR